MYKPYSVFSPPFETTSGGVRVMYGLYGALLLKGQVVHLNAQYGHPDCIAIYPEIQEGNPAQAGTVIRYILNKPGVVPAIYSDGTIKKGPTRFGDKDILYYFSRLFGETDESHYLFLPIANMHLFKDQKNKRNKTCFMVGKAILDENIKDKFIHPTDSIEITREFAQDQQALADLLNQSNVLYCYDPVSAIMEISRLCGCRVVIIPSIYSKDEFSRYEPGMNGISWGKDEEVPLDTKGFREHYSMMRADFSKKLNTFIDETQT